MIRYIERLKHWVDSTLKKLKQRNWKTWLIVVGVGYVLVEVIRAFISDAGTLLLVWGFRALQWLAAQPMGVGGLALVVYVLILLGVSWWQTRPKPTQEENVPVPLSDEERQLVQDIRAIWKRHGVLAITQLHGILRDATYNLEQRMFWGELLNPLVTKLTQTRAAFEKSLDPQNAERIEAVRGAFNEMYAAYASVMRWVALLQAQDLLDHGEGTERKLKIWRQNHRDMVNRLRDLNADPRHEGTLKYRLDSIRDSGFSAFVRESEMSPEWLALIRESQAEVERKSDSAQPSEGAS